MSEAGKSQVVIEPQVEDDDDVQELANSSGAAMLAFIAPHFPERVSPRRAAFASVGVEEEFGIESFIDICSDAGITALHCLVNSPGGSVVSSFKVARALRNYFKTIRVFVPHVAASGGTMIALVGNEIVMGRMSHLTPVDVQIMYNGMMVSTNSILRSFERFTEIYEATKMTEEESPYTLRALADKLDPIVMEEMVGENATCADYITRLLMESGVEGGIARKQSKFLTTEFRSHSTVLHRDVLAQHGFRVIHDTKYPAEWRTMRSWLKKYIGESGLVHAMTYCLPNQSGARTQARRQTAKNGRAAVRSKRGVRK